MLYTHRTVCHRTPIPIQIQMKVGLIGIHGCFPTVFGVPVQMGVELDGATAGAAVVLSAVRSCSYATVPTHRSV